MAVSSTDSFVNVTLTSNEQVVAVPFVFYDSSDLVVTADGVLQAEGSDYSVSGGDGSTGSVTMSATGPVDGDAVIIKREIPETHESAYSAAGPMPGDEVTRDIDRIYYVLQQLARAVSLSLRLEVGEAEQEEISLTTGTAALLGSSDGINLSALDPATVVSLLNLPETVIDRPLKTWEDAAARAVAVPDYVGQIGVQVDAVSAGSLAGYYIGTDTSAGSWSLMEAVPDDSIGTDQLADDAVTGDQIGDDEVDSQHIAADSLDSEHYAPGSVDGTAIGDDEVDSQHIAAGSLDSEHYAPGSVDGTAIGDDEVDSQHIAADSIDSEHYAAGSIDSEHYAAGSVDGTAIGDDEVDSQHIAAGSIDSEHYAAGSVDGTAIGDDEVDSQHIADSAVGAAALGIVGVAGEPWILQQQETAGSDGGTFNSGGWRTRDLNTEVLDDGANVSISSGTITIEPGTYYIQGCAVAQNVNQHQLRLYDVGNATELVIGMSGKHGNFNAPALIHGVITIASQTTIELQHQSSGTETNKGFGAASDMGVIEVYAHLEGWKLTT